MMSFSKAPSRAIQIVTSSTYTASTEDVLLIATSGACTVSLPACSTRFNKSLRFSVVSTGGAGALVTINAASNDEIGFPFASITSVRIPQGATFEITPVDFSTQLPPTPPATGHFWTLEELEGNLGYMPLWWDLATGTPTPATGQVIEFDGTAPVWATP